MIKYLMAMFYLEEFFRILIFHFFVVDFQLILAVALPSVKQRGVCYLTAARNLTIIELFTSTIILDGTSLSSNAQPSPTIQSGVVFTDLSSIIPTTPLPADSVTALRATAVSFSPLTPSSIHSRYMFDSQSTENVAVYFGQTDATSDMTFAKQCADQNIDIVILAFVIS